MSVGAEKLRLFLALPIPAEVKVGLSAAQNELRRLLPPRAASWKRAENMHLTLRFLGDVDSSQVEALTASVTAVTTGFGAMPLLAERLGAFPDLRYPRVVWAWAHDAAERLAELQRRVATAANRFTPEPAEERFTGHITLARIKQIKRPQAEVIASFLQRAVNRHFGEWAADHLELIRSELSPDGSRYSCLANFPL
jgi:RNA 2',3'-cyclic 3'-phosphodiesterase